jgi:DNA-binding transcriptional MerR regulator
VEATLLRIGELSRRSGVSPELLRAWERRYGLLRPVRSEGGLRLYSEDDVERVRAMRRHLGAGLAAAEAAALAARNAEAGATGTQRRFEHDAEALARALDSFDEPGAQTAIDRLLAQATLDTLLRDVVVPYLHDLGERWERGEASVAQEHFASNVLRGRLLGLARGWGRGIGPLALLACLPGEQHDLGLLAFGLALRARGWRIAYLGPDTPLDTLEQAASSLQPDLVVVNAATADRLVEGAPSLRALAGERRVAIGGAGASALDDEDGVIVLEEDPVSAAERMTDALLAD